MLKVDNIDVYYGAIHAIKGISIEVPKGEIVTLVGSNGAGKSTTLRTISGLMKPKNGTILFEDKNIVGVPAHKIVGMGLCQVPEGRHVFANMSVMENLELGAYLRNDKDGIARDLEDVFKKFPRLLERKDQISGTLSGGEQARVSLARALAHAPRLLLADEPAAHLDLAQQHDMLRLLRETAVSCAVLVVLHDLNLAARYCDRLLLLDRGESCAYGPVAEVLQAETVSRVFGLEVLVQAHPERGHPLIVAR